MLGNQRSREENLQAGNDCNAGYDNQDTEEDVVFDGGYQVPGSIYSRLFDYQKTGQLPENSHSLHEQGCPAVQWPLHIASIPHALSVHDTMFRLRALAT